MRSAFEDAAVTMEVALAHAAPRDKGNLARKIRSTVDKRQVPTWARVESTGEKPWKAKGRPFRYGWALNFSKKRAWRHRKGRNKGKLTYLWWSMTVQKVRRRVMEELMSVVGDISRRWRI